MEKTFWQGAVIFSVRRLIKPTWLNDRDQLLQPTQLLSEEFKADCLIWMLFNGSNLTASANDLEWNGKKWSIVNHFIPFTEAEVGAPDRFESDFMVQYMADKTFSAEAKAVLAEGKKLLVLINPPYAESGEGFSGGNKISVAKTKFAKKAMGDYGKATNNCLHSL